jgi:PAS domain S-box-containing protein
MVTVSPEGIITDVNEATVTVLRVPRDQLIGTTFSDYFTDPKKVAEIYQLVFTEGSAVEQPLALRHRDETLTEVLYNAPVYRDASGKGLGVFAAARDVTKRTIAQRETGRARRTRATSARSVPSTGRAAWQAKMSCSSDRPMPSVGHPVNKTAAEKALTAAGKATSTNPTRATSIPYRWGWRPRCVAAQR